MLSRQSHCIILDPASEIVVCHIGIKISVYQSELLGVTVDVCNSADFYLMSVFLLCKLNNKFRIKMQINHIGVPIMGRLGRHKAWNV